MDPAGQALSELIDERRAVREERRGGKAEEVTLA